MITRFPSTGRPLAAACLAGVSLVALAGALHAEALPASGVDAHADAVLRVVAAQVVQAPDKAARANIALVESLLKTRPEGRAGAKIVPVSRREAAATAIRNSRTAAIAKADPARYEEMLRELQSVYDPIFDVSIGYTRPESNDRSKVGTIRRKAFTAFAGKGGEYEPTSNPLTTDPQVNLVKFLMQTPKVDTETIKASSDDAFGDVPDYTTFSVGLTQKLPWGGKIVLSDATTWRQVYYRKGNYWEDGQFSSTLTATFSTPLPGTKGFGEDNPDNAAIRRAEILRRQADWVSAGQINDLLYQVDSAFFELARRTEALRANVANLDDARRQAERVGRLYDEQVADRYQKASVEAEVANARARVEQAVQAYLNASNTLSLLIGDPAAGYGGPIHVPHSYDGEPTAPTTKIDEMMAVARESRPDLHVRSLGADIAKVGEAAAVNQAKPDVSANVSLKLAENGSIYGFRDPLRSQVNLFDPDTLTGSQSVTFTRPLGNRAALAAVESARVDLADADLAVRETEGQVRRELAERTAALRTALARVASAKAELRHQRAADQSRRRRLDEENKNARDLMNAPPSQGGNPLPQGDVPTPASGQTEDMGFDINGLKAENPNAAPIGGETPTGPTRIPVQGHDELIRISRDVLAAEVSLTDAKIDAWKALSGLAAAQGVLAGRIPVDTAASKLERDRLKALSAVHPMTFPALASARAVDRRKALP